MTGTNGSALKSPPQVTTEVSEVFSSLQGEGTYLGKKQIFVRFGRCNMHCHYCDEYEKMQPGVYHEIDLEKLLGTVIGLEARKGPHHSVSLTGGEPLLYTKFLQTFLPELKHLGFKLYLETNGSFPHQLASIIRYIDIISMDMKPPSSSGDRPMWTEHQEFLKLALATPEKDTFVKMVITPETSPEEVLHGVGIIQSVNEDIPLILQPVSEPTQISEAALQLIETSIMEKASGLLTDVRIIPQMHKGWGIR